MKPEVIGHSLQISKLTISTQIKMVISKLFYPFVISDAGDSHMEYELNTKPDYVHM